MYSDLSAALYMNWTEFLSVAVPGHKGYAADLYVKLAAWILDLAWVTETKRRRQLVSYRLTDRNAQDHDKGFNWVPSRIVAFIKGSE